MVHLSCGEYKIGLVMSFILAKDVCVWSRVT